MRFKSEYSNNTSSITRGRQYKNSKQNGKTPQNELPDEIALRDEIFQLKRQIMLLKKANEKNIIKVRKYEDEAKKKDRQIEQLMDPVKNGDVRKLLSTKGAALLLNLKEQNNALIQMILDKDAQIRRLLSEIKTSKLYASTRRTELYRTEVERLRNLLIKSESLTREAARDAPQRRSICVGGPPSTEMSLSSDPSSPRDLEELQFTIQNLEMHMKYTNELLAKKNEQIMQLTDQLESYRCNTCRRSIQTKRTETPVNATQFDFQKCSIFEKSPDTTEEDRRDSIHTLKVIPPEGSSDSQPLELFERNVGQPRGRNEQGRLSNSAPAGSVKDRQDFGDAAKDSTLHCARSSDDVKPKASDGRYLEVPCGDDGRRTRMPENGFLVENQNHSDGTPHYRLTPEAKTEPDNRTEPDKSDFVDFERVKRRNIRMLSVADEDDSDIETAEFEMMEKEIENDQIESPAKVTPPPTTDCSHELCEVLNGQSPSPEAEEDQTTAERRVMSDAEEEEESDRASSERECRHEDDGSEPEGGNPSDGSEGDGKGSTRECEEIGGGHENAGFRLGDGANGGCGVGSYGGDVDYSSLESASGESSLREVEVEAEINHNEECAAFGCVGGENDNDDDDVIVG